MTSPTTRLDEAMTSPTVQRAEALTSSPEEQLIRETNSDIYTIAVDQIDIIPDFTRVYESTAVWKREKNAVWLNLHRELEAIAVYDDLLQMIESDTSTFHYTPREMLLEFIETCPTLIWCLLLGPDETNIKVFGLLVAAGALNFIDDALLLLDVKNDGRVRARVYPAQPYEEILSELRDVNTAQLIYNHYGKIMKHYDSWPVERFMKLNDVYRGDGYIYYMVVSAASWSMKDWMTVWSAYAYAYGDLLDYWLRTLSKDDLEELKRVNSYGFGYTDNLIKLSSQYSISAFKFLLSIYEDPPPLFYYPFLTVEIIDTIENAYPGWLIKELRKDHGKITLIRSPAILSRLLDLGMVTNGDSIIHLIQKSRPYVLTDEISLKQTTIITVCLQHPIVGPLIRRFVTSDDKIIQTVLGDVILTQWRKQTTENKRLMVDDVNALVALGLSKRAVPKQLRSTVSLFTH